MKELKKKSDFEGQADKKSHIKEGPKKPKKILSFIQYFFFFNIFDNIQSSLAQSTVVFNQIFILPSLTWMLQSLAGVRRHSGPGPPGGQGCCSCCCQEVD